MARVLHDDSTFEIKETDIPDVQIPDKETSYTCRYLSTQKYRELQLKNTKPVINKASRAMEKEVDPIALADDLIDHVLAGWTGILDQGKPADCTRENKLRLDGQVKSGLIGLAGLNKIENAPVEKDRSFRPTP